MQSDPCDIGRLRGVALGITYAEVVWTAFKLQEVITMNNCHVFHPERVLGGDQVSTLDFKGNKPAVPPLTTESVESIIYLIDEEEQATRCSLR